MSTQIRKPDHHFKAYYEDNSLLIQFMIVEFVHTVQLAARLKALVSEHFNSEGSSQSGLANAKQILEHLIRYHRHQEPSSYSRWTKGCLTKLKEYCELFSSNSLHEEKHPINLHMSAHQALLNAIHAQELLNSLIINPYIPNSEGVLNLLPIKRILGSFQSKINQLIRYFPQVITPFWDDENVILCLLRNRPLLLDIYGADFIDKRFKWPVNTNELVQLLSTRYQARGFDSIFSTIQQLFEADNG